LCYTEMRILFINPRFGALKLSSDHPVGSWVQCFKIADVFVKYSRRRRRNVHADEACAAGGGGAFVIIMFSISTSTGISEIVT